MVFYYRLIGMIVKMKRGKREIIASDNFVICLIIFLFSEYAFRISLVLIIKFSG
jgi:hypothetical protein